MIAFVIGCARSGTTWLGRVLQANPGFRVAIEDPVIFPLVDEMALYPDRTSRLFPRLVELYRRRLIESEPDLFVDKSHQNIWLAERLADAFPDAYFLGIERSINGTVASMLRHGPVLGHFWRRRMYPDRVPHLGITPDLAEVYDQLPMTVKCALRWLSHHRRLNHLRSLLGDKLLYIPYESFVLDPGSYGPILSDFLGRNVIVPEGDRTAVSKWMDVLSQKQLEMIEGLLRAGEIGPPEPSSAS